MQTKNRLLLTGGFCFLIDQILKYCSLQFWTQEKILFQLLGWQPFKNTGVALGIKLSPSIIVVLSVIILMLLLYLLKNTSAQDRGRIAGLSLVIAGATSNLMDRLLRGAVIDYWFILGGVINLADIMIGVGFIFLITKIKQGGYVSQT